MPQLNESTCQQVPLVNQLAGAPESTTLNVADVLKAVLEQNQQLTGAYREMNAKLTALINKHNSDVITPTVASKPAKAAKVAGPNYAIVLRQGNLAVRVVERKSRSGLKGSAPTARVVWPSETKARAFWRSLPGMSEYRLRLEEGDWKLSFEVYDSKKHAHLPSQFRGMSAVPA